MDIVASKNYGFCDLSLSKTYDLTKLSLVEKLGFGTVAINTFVEEPNGEPKKKKRKGDKKAEEKPDYIPAPIDIPPDIKDTCKINILQRITIEFSDSGIASKLNQTENLKKYDIIAVLPKTLQSFQYACSSMDIDIITFEPENKLPFKIHRKLYRQATERGIFFELMYSPAIKDSSLRKNIISMAHIYHAVGKSKNIILTSGAENYTQLRGVYDVVNLGFILGMNSNQSLEVIRSNARRLVLKAHGRRCGKHYVLVTPLNEESAQNKILDE